MASALDDTSFPDADKAPAEGGSRLVPPRAATGRLPKGLGVFFSVFTVDRLLVAGLCTASVGFFAVAYSISLKDPDYFSRQLISSFRPSNIDPITTGTIGAGQGRGMPVPSLVRARPLVAADYQIVTVFQTEAVLATTEELVRVKVGSVVPGLGRILAIHPTDTGGTVEASEATLRSVSQ